MMSRLPLVISFLLFLASVSTAGGSSDNKETDVAEGEPNDLIQGYGDSHNSTKERVTKGQGLGTRSKKLLNLFTVVRFANTPCIGTDNRNGTCYSAVECSQRGGSSAGSCANGYGVCCTFTIGCGQTSSENCTYFTSTGGESGQCCATICPCNNNICQLRLDFITHVITGPSTVSTVVGTALNGVLNPTGVNVASNTQCLTDTFSVTAPGNNVPPVICGTNTGEHMYLDSVASCNMLCFQLGNTAVGLGAIATRSWNIKVTQYSCDFDNLAPDGCTQYFFGSTTGTVQSFNFNNAAGSQLANQNQNICVRRERGNCRICWATMATADFQLSGTTGVAGIQADTTCCAFGANGMGVVGFDCVMIPGATTSANMAAVPGDEFCGRKTLTPTATVCCEKYSYMI